MTPQINCKQRRTVEARIRAKKHQGSGGPPRAGSMTPKSQGPTQVEQNHHAASTCAVRLILATLPTQPSAGDVVMFCIHRPDANNAHYFYMLNDG